MNLCFLGRVRFYNSNRFRKKAGDAKLPFYHSFVQVLMSLAAESCRSRAESVHLLKPIYNGKGLQEFQLCVQTTPQMCKMMLLNCSICLIPIYGLERCIEFRLPKAVHPSIVRSVFGTEPLSLISFIPRKNNCSASFVELGNIEIGIGRIETKKL